MTFVDSFAVAVAAGFHSSVCLQPLHSQLLWNTSSLTQAPLATSRLTSSPQKAQHGQSKQGMGPGSPLGPCKPYSSRPALCSTSAQKAEMSLWLAIRVSSHCWQ